MKIIRSSKHKLESTKSKKEKLILFIKEYKRVANYVLENYDIPKSKSSFLSSEVYKKLKEETGTWLLSHPLQDLLGFCYGQLQAYNSLVENYKINCNNKAKEKLNIIKKLEVLKQKSSLTYKEKKDFKYFKKYLKNFRYDNKPSRPFLSNKANISLTSQCIKIEETDIKEFDLMLHFASLGISSLDIPLKKTRVYKNLLEMGKRLNYLILNEDFCSISFEIEAGSKKLEGNLASIDSNFSNLALYVKDKSLDLILEKLPTLISKIRGKKFNSKSYIKSKKELDYYIREKIKTEIPWKDLRLIVLEDLRNIKFKIAVKERLTKNIRSVFHQLSFSKISEVVKNCSEINRVSFRTVKPFYTSLTCSDCGHMEKKNRLSQADFKCCKCGFTINADLNASVNILSRFIRGKYGSSFKTNSEDIFL